MSLCDVAHCLRCHSSLWMTPLSRFAILGLKNVQKPLGCFVNLERLAVGHNGSVSSLHVFIVKLGSA
jgi:hypothetical protein